MRALDRRVVRPLIKLTNAVDDELVRRGTFDEALVTGDEVLIGQVILEKLDLLVDCTNQRLVPNPANPYYPVAIIKQMGDRRLAATETYFQYDKENLEETGEDHKRP